MVRILCTPTMHDAAHAFVNVLNEAIWRDDRFGSGVWENMAHPREKFLDGARRELDDVRPGNAVDITFHTGIKLCVPTRDSMNLGVAISLRWPPKVGLLAPSFGFRRPGSGAEVEAGSGGGDGVSPGSH